jgi:YD repeat-containing protein
MLNRHAISLRSLFSLATHTNLNKLAVLQANQTLGQAGVSAEVQLSDGALIVRDHLHHFPDAGSAIEFCYAYNSKAVDAPWELCASRAIKEIVDGKQIIMREADGCERFYYFHNGQYESADSEGLATLRFDATMQSYVWHHTGTRITEYLSPKHNQVTQRCDAQGLITTFEYRDHTLSKIISTSSGAIYTFDKIENKMFVYRQTNSADDLITTYTFADKCLTQSKTKDGYEIIYEKGHDNKLRSISQLDTSQYDFSFLADGKLRSLRLGDTEINAANIEYKASTTILKLATGELLTLTFNNNRQVVASELQGDTYQYIYHASGQVKNIIHPDESVESFEFDSLTGLMIKHINRDGSYEVFEYSHDVEPVLIRHSQYTANSQLPVLVDRYV